MKMIEYPSTDNLLGDDILLVDQSGETKKIKIKDFVAKLGFFLNLNYIADNTNLNNVTTPGNYLSESGEVSRTLKNSPTKNAFFMTVEKISSNSFTQEITEYTQYNAKKIYRNCKNGLWGGWLGIYTESNKPDPSDIGAVSIWGDNTIYDGALVFEINNGAEFLKNKVHSEGFDLIIENYGDNDSGDEDDIAWTRNTSYRRNFIDLRNADGGVSFSILMEYGSSYICYDFGSYQSRYFANSKNGYADLGQSSLKWNNIYATNGTIQTSDRNEKNSETDLSISIIIPFILGLLPKMYKMNSGSSDRFHWGLISQDVEELMQKLGITDLQFAGFIKSPKKRIIIEDENGNPLKEPIEEVIEGEYEYSLRYDEFIAPIVLFIQELYRKYEKHEERITTLETENAALKDRVDKAEARITELETMLNQVLAKLN